MWHMPRTFLSPNQESNLDLTLRTGLFSSVELFGDTKVRGPLSSEGGSASGGSYEGSIDEL